MIPLDPHLQNHVHGFAVSGAGAELLLGVLGVKPPRSLFVSHYLCLYACQSNNCNDIVCGAASGQVVYGLCDTLQHWPIGFRLCQSLYQFVSDVSGIQIREDQNVCFSCYFAVRSFGCTYAWNDSGIKLQLAVECEIRVCFFCNSFPFRVFGDVITSSPFRR